MKETAELLELMEESTSFDEAIERAWGKVIQAVNKILEADSHFGFSKIEAKLNPSIHDIVHSLGIIDFALTYFLDSELLEHDEIRLALNAKQCVLHLRRVAAALESKDKAEYDAAIHDLTTQPQI